MSHLARVIGTELRSSARSGSALNQRAISLTLYFLLFIVKLTQSRVTWEEEPQLPRRKSVRGVIMLIGMGGHSSPEWHHSLPLPTLPRQSGLYKKASKV